MTRTVTFRNRRALLRAAKQIIRERFRDPDLSLIEVAEAVSTSPRQLQRIFREEGDADFRGHLLGIRMRAARGLLTHDEVPAYRVARRVGYRRASGLRQAFKRYYGYNPSAIQAPPPNYVGTEIDPHVTAANTD